MPRILSQIAMSHNGTEARLQKRGRDERPTVKYAVKQIAKHGIALKIPIIKTFCHNLEAVCKRTSTSTFIFIVISTSNSSFIIILIFDVVLSSFQFTSFCRMECQKFH